MIIKVITDSKNTIITIPKMHRKYWSNNPNNRFVINFVANLVVQPTSVMRPSWTATSIKVHLSLVVECHNIMLHYIIYN